MTTSRVAGQDFDLSAELVEQAASRLDPEPIQEHYVAVAGRRFPVKQVLAAATGLDRADFTSHQARSVLRRLGLPVYRLGASATPSAAPGARGPYDGAEAELLARFSGRWVAQQGLEVLFDADSPQAVVRWLRRHHRVARVWRVPASPAETGSALSAP